MSGTGSTKANRQQRGTAQIAWANAGVPDPFHWLSEHWGALIKDGRIKPGSMSKKALHAEALALQLMPYLHAKLKQTEIDMRTAPEITVTIGGE